MGKKTAKKSVKTAAKAKPKTKVAAKRSTQGGEKYEQSGAPWWKAYLPE
jgi:hypothetical protein